mmetsp:Transcript_6895/g.15849  ORF Transcript_6895/g.15849 Transcript_6895/m.15849 type:complete len:230 (-) Transcript_6895:117-806(-)
MGVETRRDGSTKHPTPTSSASRPASGYRGTASSSHGTWASRSRRRVTATLQGSTARRSSLTSWTPLWGSTRRRACQRPCGSGCETTPTSSSSRGCSLRKRTSRLGNLCTPLHSRFARARTTNCCPRPWLTAPSAPAGARTSTERSSRISRSTLWRQRPPTPATSTRCGCTGKWQTRAHTSSTSPATSENGSRRLKKHARNVRSPRPREPTATPSAWRINPSRLALRASG